MTISLAWAFSHIELPFNKSMDLQPIQFELPGWVNAFFFF